MSHVSSDQLAERYGRPTPRRRLALLAAVGVLCVVALGWLAWIAWAQSNPEVQSSLRTYEVVDTHQVDAAITVKARSTSVEASCLVRAFAADRSTVGERNFDVGGVQGTEVRTVRLRTEREASSVVLVGCTTKDQTRPR